MVVLNLYGEVHEGVNPIWLDQMGKELNSSSKIMYPILQTTSAQRRLSIATPASEEAQQSPEPDGEIEIVGDEPVELPQPPSVTEEDQENAEAGRKGEPTIDVRSKGSSSSVHDEGDEFKRSESFERRG